MRLAAMLAPSLLLLHFSAVSRGLTAEEVGRGIGAVLVHQHICLGGSQPELRGNGGAGRGQAVSELPCAPEGK